MDLESARMTIRRLIKSYKESSEAIRETKEEIARVKDASAEAFAFRERSLEEYAKRQGTVLLSEKNAWKGEAKMWEM